jgi:hypothetical protein
MYGLSLVPFPLIGKWDQGGPGQAVFPIPAPWVDENKERSGENVLIVSSENIVK